MKTYNFQCLECGHKSAKMFKTCPSCRSTDIDIYVEPVITPSMKIATSSVIRRIAEAKIKAYGLKDTVDEYIAKTVAVTEGRRP